MEAIQGSGGEHAWDQAVLVNKRRRSGKCNDRLLED
jgi:hypothetical protein